MTPEQQSGAVVSDLHILTNRTTVHEHMDDIEAAAEAADLFVFNGDIFDFKWSTHGAFQESVAVAVAWIEDLLRRNHDCRFVFLIGNHDGLPSYKAELVRLSNDYPNMTWEEFYLRLDDKVFLHGDVCQTTGSPAELETYRLKCNEHLRDHPVLHMLYWLVSHVGILRLFVKMISKESCARRISQYLSTVMGSEFAEIREVYFGHVHTPFTDFPHNGRIFHNTGAALKRLHLQIMTFDFSENGTEAT